MIQTIKDRIAKINNGQVPEGYEKTSFGIFPCDWENKKLGELAYLSKDKFDPDKSQNNPICIELEHLSTETGQIIGHTYGKYQNSIKNSFSMGNILFGKLRPYLRKFYLADFNGVCSTEIWVIKSKEHICNEFLYKLISSELFIKRANESSFGTKMPRADWKKIEVEEYILPKTEQEQSRIAQILMQWDKTIELQEKLIRSYQKLKKYYLSKMFPKKGSLYPEIRFAGFTEPWKQCKLGELGEFTSNGVDKLSCQNEIPVNLLNYMDVYNRRKITASNCFTLMQVTAKPIQVNNNNVLAGDVYFTPTSETAEDIGHILVIEENLPNTVYSYHLMRYRPKEGVFFKTYPNYGFDTKELHRQMSIKAKGVQRFVISKSDFEDLCLTYPNYEEQQKIAVFFTQIDNIITHNQQKLDKLIAQRKALMQVLLTGIVRV